MFTDPPWASRQILSLLVSLESRLTAPQMRVGALLPLAAVLVASATAKTRHGGAAGVPTAADNGCPTQFQQRCTCGLGQYPLSAHTEHKYADQNVEEWFPISSLELYYVS